MTSLTLLRFGRGGNHPPTTEDDITDQLPYGDWSDTVQGRSGAHQDVGAVVTDSAQAFAEVFGALDSTDPRRASPLMYAMGRYGIWIRCRWCRTELVTWRCHWCGGPQT